MLKKEFIKHSCYKLMFLLGIIDVLATVVGGTFAGYYFIQGDIWCTNKTFFYYTISALTGSKLYDMNFYSYLFIACWVGACATGFLLLINRIFDLFYPNVAKMLFEGNKTYFWLILPLSYMFYCVFFTQPFFINSYLGALFMDPFVGVLNNTYMNPQMVRSRLKQII